ncbi:MAG: alpha/beta hydrolase [Bacteroidia bacterium]|nr:alpha/beta hydrolase [Bacteroidia bacterium]
MRAILLLILAFTTAKCCVAQGKYYTTFDNAKIYYEVEGSGPTVLLVHGFIVDGESWKRGKLRQALIDQGFRVITLDMRGNGRSDKPHTPEAYANDAEAKDIIGLLTMLKVETYAVIGYSRGSIIAARLLVLDNRVNKAILGGMGDDFTNPDWPRRIMFYKALVGEDVPELAGMVKYVQESKLDQQALAFLQKEQPSTSKEELGKITVPVLVVCGDQDSDNGSAGKLASLIRGAVHKQVPGTHNDAARSQEFANAVIQFLRN